MTDPTRAEALSPETLAALPGLLDAAGIVKPLEWEPIERERSREEPIPEVVGYEAGTPLSGYYLVEDATSGFDVFYDGEVVTRDAPSPEEAKAAAQADYAARVIACLDAPALALADRLAEAVEAYEGSDSFVETQDACEMMRGALAAYRALVPAKESGHGE